MHTVQLKGTDLSLGKYIPVISRVFFEQDPIFVPHDIVGVSFGDIFTSKPLELRDKRYRVRNNIHINQDLLRNNPVFFGKKVILMFSERDVLLERIWWDRNGMHFFDDLGEMGFHAITTPNFSVFLGECPVGHAWNIKKSLLCGKTLEQKGIPVIPHIYAVNEYQLARWYRWLTENPGIKMVTMNCQLQRKSKVGRQMVVDALSGLFSNTGVNVILQGSDNRILAKLQGLEKRLHIAESGSFKRLEITSMRHLPSSLVGVSGEL